MRTQILRPVATVTVTDENDEDLEVVADDARVVVDSGAVPYGSATVQVPLIAPETIEAIDPREEVRATVAIGEEGDTPRVFDLVVRSRRVDHKAKRVEMQLATDEALLQDYAPLEDDDTPRDHEASLRDLIDYVLGVVIPGAELEAGSTDADLTAAWPLTNLLSNTKFEASTDGWSAGYNTSAVARVTDVGGFAGGNALRATSAAADHMFVDHTDSFSVSPGRLYTFSIYMRSNASGRTGYVMVTFHDNDDNEVQDNVSAGVALSTSGWTRVYKTVTIPSNVVAISLHAYMLADASGQYMYVDAAMLNEGVLEDYFDGGTTDTSLYTYAFEGTADASPSSRTPVVERLPELFTWPAGTSAWDFLQPLTAVAGLRLYCDETRAWRLIDPAEFTSPGRVTLSPLNSTEGVDVISRENADIYCTGVVVKYSWTDPTGTAKTATDTAGTAGRVFIVELNRPYPGPGVAAAILARRQGQGRTQDVTALAVWTTQPGQEASISLPGTVDQIGRVASVEWELPAGLMRVGTTGLVDVPPEAWLALDPGESWLDSPIGESWMDEVI